MEPTTVKRNIKLLTMSLSLFVLSSTAFSYSANKVWFEFLDTGRYRVYVNYTIPALKEFRSHYVDFIKKKDAEAYYWSIVKGADFFPSDPKSNRFRPTAKPDPW